MEYGRLEKGVIWVAGFVVLYLFGLAFNLGTDDIISASLMAMLCIGFTFTYMVEGFPNLAHTSYAIIGAVTSFYLTRFHRFNPYDTWPFSVLWAASAGSSATGRPGAGHRRGPTT